MAVRKLGNAYRVAVLAGAALTSACGGSGGGTTYDAHFDCRESIACAEKTLGPAPAGTLDQCLSDASKTYKGLSASDKALFDDAFDACSDQHGCKFADCAKAQLGDASDSGNGVSVGISRVVGGGASSETCGVTKPISGSIESSAGAFAYSDAEALFWVNGEGCLTEVDAKLKSGNCYVEFAAQGLLDDQGRYQITTVTVEANGLCPGYPGGLSSIYLETARDKPFGTIEVQHEGTDWHACTPGELIVRPEVILDGITKPDVGFSGVEIHIPGSFAMNEHDPSGSCPTKFP